MNGSFDGDLIRPLGLVTLHCAYAEGEIDELLCALLEGDAFDATKRQWPVGQKLALAERLIENLSAEELAPLVEALHHVRGLFERRNVLVHGRLYAGGRLVSGRADVPDQRITEEDLKELAKLVFAAKEKIFVHRCKELAGVLERRNTPGAA
ncbi:MAG: hypothetical protein RIC85_00890 [Gammaproteobacteria bacterium]